MIELVKKQFNLKVSVDQHPDGSESSDWIRISLETVPEAMDILEKLIKTHNNNGVSNEGS
jgi:hypothetical protein